jgi:hypothetical protein
LGLGWWYIKNKRRRRRMYNTLLPELQIDHSFSRGVWEASCCSPKRKRKVDGMYIVFGPEDCRHTMHLSGDLGELLVAGRSPKKKKQQSIQPSGNVSMYHPTLHVESAISEQYVK